MSVSLEPGPEEKAEYHHCVRRSNRHPKQTDYLGANQGGECVRLPTAPPLPACLQTGDAGTLAGGLARCIIILKRFFVFF